MAGVLCARVRVEEKRIIEALAAAGVPARPIPPCSAPMPIPPIPAGPPTQMLASGEVAIDRIQDRVIAGAVLPALRASGMVVIDAGLAASANRLAIASALAAAGAPRPRTMLVTSEASGMDGFAAMGSLATLLPMNPASPEIRLLDQEIAEAVFEHRNILGTSHDAIALLQAGIVNGDRVSVLVVGGVAVAVSRGIPPDAAARTLGLAEFAAAALRAEVIAVDVASIDGEAVVWDVHPTPDFRDMTALGARSAAEAIADLVVARLNRLSDRDPVAVAVAVAGPRTMSLAGFETMTELRREVADGFVLTA